MILVALLFAVSLALAAFATVLAVIVFVVCRLRHDERNWPRAQARDRWPAALKGRW